MALACFNPSEALRVVMVLNQSTKFEEVSASGASQKYAATVSIKRSTFRHIQWGLQGGVRVSEGLRMQ
jgi:hypothetical protein